MNDSDRPRTLADELARRGFDPCGMVVSYNDLHPLDACADFRDIRDVVRVNAHHVLDRMHDGPRIPDGSIVMSFIADGDRRARLTAFRRFVMRRPGIVPGDIVYDYDAAHLLHSFIARTEHPYFYDVIDEAGLDDAIGTLAVEWPRDSKSNLRSANDAHLFLAR